jgi:hypothetical protein
MSLLFADVLALVAAAFRTLDIGDYKTCVTLLYPEGSIKCWGEMEREREKERVKERVKKKKKKISKRHHRASNLHRFRNGC